MSTTVIITDDRGRHAAQTEDDQPEPGSVVLVNGQWGTAYQRYFTDGLWHRVGGGRGRTWTEMLGQRNMVLVYDAPRRD